MARSSPTFAEEQATADRDAGTLLIRDSGTPADTRWIDERDDLPRIVEYGKHIARTRRYIRNYAHEIEPDELVAHVRMEAGRGDGWVKLVGDWIDRGTGDLAPCWPREAVIAAVAAAHEEGARTTAHCFAEESLHDFAAAGTDCIEHASGLDEESTRTFAAQGIAVVPTLINIANFPDLAAPAARSSPVPRPHARPARPPVRDDRAGARGRHTHRCRDRRGWCAAARPGRQEALELAKAGLSEPRRARGRVVEGPASGSATKGSRRAPRPTSSSIPRTRVPISPFSALQPQSSCAATEFDDPSLGAAS